MAIQFARIEIAGRSNGGNACCKGAYNARAIIKDEKTNITYNFKNKGDNVYHEILLPEYTDKKFLSVSEFMNEVERCEKRKDSQLLKDIVLALPDDKELTLEDRINITHLLIEKRGWVKEGLGVQMDIHEPHKGERNWHAHLLVTTRRFTPDGLTFGAKATDLNPEFKKFGNKAYAVPEADQIHEELKDIINNYFKKLGLENRVDAISLNPHEHVGAVRMRSIFNEAAKRNEERREAEIEHLNSGKRVLEKVTKHMSVFTRGDLSRAVKCIPDSEVQARLVEDTISDKSIIPLYREEGSKTKYFTTTKIRDEENKILRLSGYVSNVENVMSGGSKIKRIANDLISGAAVDLTGEQHKALGEILLSESGLRILRGRAGAGKSHVLGKANRVATMSGVNVIGLAPTHKSKLGLAECGFESVDTVKGMLFKLANGRFSLPKYSLLVVDEAGMIGNDDYKELLRVAATRKCNIILAGDERQLASVQRGGMFEVFAGRYGSSTILDIKRQVNQWGKSVAMSMSEGRVESAISILESENRIKWDDNAHASMESLIKDWNQSEYSIYDRMILAVKNSDVAALNHGVRQYLKLSGDLKGEEFAVAGNHYMQGDRVLITKTNKELGLINGDLAEVIEVSESKFTIKTKKVVSLETNATNKTNENNESKEESGAGYKNISFNPSEYNGFRHGYATTVFKAQGASILDVYMFHNGFAGIRNSYVSLSRNKIDLNLYANKESTSNLNSLIRQLSQDAETGSSLSYLTKSELEDRGVSYRLANDKNALVRGFNSLLDFASNTATKFTDKYIPSAEYYNYKEPSSKYETVEKVIEKTFAEIKEHNQAIMEEKLVVGGSTFYGSDKSKTTSVDNDVIININITNTAHTTAPGNVISANTNNVEVSGSTVQITGEDKLRASAKSRFYANADRMRLQQRYEAQKEEWGREYEQLQSEIKFKAEAIARDLLGDPNKRLSNGRELRYGDHGKLAVRITGEKAGTWYDFSRGEGGDLFHLVQETRKTSFKEAAEYLRGQVGMSSSNTKTNLQLVYNHANSNLTIDRIKSKESEQRLFDQKQAYSTKLYKRSKDIGERSVAHRYLSGTRAINVDIGADIKTAGIYEKSNKGYLPALIAYARDKDGNITGGQHLLLDKKTNGKANIEVPKKSFGTISGSFVDLGNIDTKTITDDNTENSKKSGITIIAEGIETGLSVKQALSEHGQKRKGGISVLCSLGISNIRNYQSGKDEKIIIAADNDGKDSMTAKTVANAKVVLEERGAFVEIVQPENDGDFNDVLQDKEKGGSKVIANCFKAAIARHSAKTLEQYIANMDTSRDVIAEGHQHLNEEDKANLAIIQKYNISQESILNAWRSDPSKGKEKLASNALEISLTEKRIEAKSEILDLAAKYGIRVDKSYLVTILLTESSGSCEQECIKHVLSDFAKQKQEAEKIGQIFNIIRCEDKFLSEVNINNKKELDQNLQDRLDLSKTDQSKNIIASIKQNMEANHKQGIISYDDLLKKVVAGGYDIKGLDSGLKSLANENREKNLRFMDFDLSQLSKLNYKYDSDILVSNVKSMSDQEKVIYSNKLLAEHGDKYFSSALAEHIKEKNNATNFNGFMKAIGREQKTLLDLYNDHKFAAQAIDEHYPGKFKMLSLTHSAYEINAQGGMNKVMKTFNYAVKYKITDQEKIMFDLKRTGGDLEYVHDILDRKCKTHLNNQFKAQKEQEKTFEKEKQQKPTPEKSFYHPVTLSFDNEPNKDIRKRIESLGIRFDKFRQEWHGNVKEQDLTKLTKSLAIEKHYINIGLKEEYRKSTKPEKQQEIKIDRGFGM